MARLRNRLRRRIRSLIAGMLGLAVGGMLLGCTEPEPLDPGQLILGELVTDARGSYQRTLLDPQATALDPAVLTDPDALFSADEVQEALDWLLPWIASEAVDGPVLEQSADSAAWAAWQQRALAEWLDPVYGEDLLMNVLYQDGTVGRTTLLVTDDSLPIAFEFLRDGGPRFASGAIELTSIIAERYQDELPYLVVRGQAGYLGRVADEAVVQQVLLSSADFQSADAVRQAFSGLRDEEPELVELDFDFEYHLARFDGAWRITSSAPGTGIDYRWLATRD